MSDHLIGKKEIWIVGAGPMAMDHTRVALHLGIKPVIISRGEESAKHFETEMKIPVSTGGLSNYLISNKPDRNTYIVIATGTESLMPSLLQFIDLDFAKILVEKPAAISIEELLENEESLEKIQERVFVGYNRRFYPSVQKALDLIEVDGGLQSMHFEFTEWSHKIEPLEKALGVKENWFFANSTHVVDLAFYMAGMPKELQSFSKRGSLNWHKNSFFSGAGITVNGVVFSYHSNWESAGRWGIELMTAKRKIVLKPLEELKIIDRGTINEYALNDVMSDSAFKPGLKAQLEMLLQDELIEGPSLKNHFEMTKQVYRAILNSAE